MSQCSYNSASASSEYNVMYLSWGKKKQHGNPQSTSYYGVSFLFLGYFKLLRKIGLALCLEKPLPVSRLSRNVVSHHFQEMPSFHEYATSSEYREGWPWEKAKGWMPR